jgi:hypothetical protein
MRGLLLSATLICAPLCTYAQNAETVIVERPRDLPGLWKLNVPSSIAVGFSGPAKFGTMSAIYCRVTDDDEVYCLNDGYARHGTVAREGNAVHIAWGSMMARFVIDGLLTDGAITGVFSLKLSGIRHDAPQSSENSRVILPQQDDGASQYLADLIAQVKTGGEIAGISDDDRSTLTPIAHLGPVDAVAYLGTSPRRVGQPDGDLFGVYIVEFARGERLCGLHQRNDGTLDSFRCI